MKHLSTTSTPPRTTYSTTHSATHSANQDRHALQVRLSAVCVTAFCSACDIQTLNQDLDLELGSNQSDYESEEEWEHLLNC